MNTLTKLSRIEASLREIIQEEGGLELELSKPRVKTVLRIADQLNALIKEQREDIATEAEAAKKQEEAERAKAVAAVMQMAEQYGLDVKVLARKPKSAPAATHPKVEATSADIREWARKQNMDVPNRGIIPRRIVEAYGLAHAS